MYDADKKPLQLDELTSLANDDTFVVGDTSDTSKVVKRISKANLVTDLGSNFASALGTDDNYVTDAEKTKLANITVTQPVDLDQIESDTATNNAKVTNATHSGDMVGATSLTAQPALITGKPSATVASGDLLLIADVNDSNNLKQVTAQAIADLGGGGTPGGLDTQVQFNDGGTFGGDAGLTYNKTTDTLTATNLATDLVALNGGVNQDYDIKANGNNGLHIDGKQSGAVAEVDVSSADKDGTDNVAFKAFGVGDSGQANNERLAMGYNAANTDYRIHTVAQGTGTVRTLRIYTGSNTSQIVLNTDGTTSFGGDVTVPDEAYDATAWNGSLEVPTKNAIRDKIESMSTGSGITRSVVVTSGNTTAGSSASTDYVVLVAGAHTVTLPTAVSNTNLYTIKNNHSANITVNTTSSQTIDGTTTISLAPEESVQIISNNTNWNIV